MPYISLTGRELLAKPLADVIVAVRDHVSREEYAGVCNFAVTSILASLYLDANVGKFPSYANINEAVGVLECAKLELYRRVAAPKEDRAARDNGDILEYQHASRSAGQLSGEVRHTMHGLPSFAPDAPRRQCVRMTEDSEFKSPEEMERLFAPLAESRQLGSTHTLQEAYAEGYAKGIETGLNTPCACPEPAGAAPGEERTRAVHPHAGEPYYMAGFTDERLQAQADAAHDEKVAAFQAQHGANVPEVVQWGVETNPPATSTVDSEGRVVVTYGPEHSRRTFTYNNEADALKWNETRPLRFDACATDHGKGRAYRVRDYLTQETLGHVTVGTFLGLFGQPYADEVRVDCIIGAIAESINGVRVQSTAPASSDIDWVVTPEDKALADFINETGANKPKPRWFAGAWDVQAILDMNAEEPMHFICENDPEEQGVKFIIAKDNPDAAGNLCKPIRIGHCWAGVFYELFPAPKYGILKTGSARRIEARHFREREMNRTFRNVR